MGKNIPAVGLLKDPAPTLFIQDEMHLMTESLGTFDAHYESFINYYAKELLPPTQRKQIRFVGATATISMSKPISGAISHGRRRFPCEYPSAKTGETFIPTQMKTKSQDYYSAMLHMAVLLQTDVAVSIYYAAHLLPYGSIR